MWFVDPFPSCLPLFRSFFGLHNMMREQLKHVSVTPKHGRTTQILSLRRHTSGFMNSAQSFFEGLAELDSEGVPRAYERIHINSRYHVNFALHAAIDGLLKGKARCQPDWDSTYFSELIPSVWHWT